MSVKESDVKRWEPLVGSPYYSRFSSRPSTVETSYGPLST